ncbi:hypothetical protein Aph01nite_64090 [Acrocarpospora phusangensis]|uniref:DUF2630 domain-containing protein n=1 Tax=Acrocarpospora phusangensis TaxID=1070424 RepID=A0A919UNN9_9ACTN|nr:DUF2630 family protein [Acrocarpospora phusangensis]GIH28099.1 hypothetical protein Aph01nite_64090 [Acrocarpospora phusangensis]
MRDHEILSKISELVDEERELRDRLSAGELSSSEEHARIKTLEESLDQCWDLLRQRRAKRRVGDDPDNAEARPVSEVEGYRQ